MEVRISVVLFLFIIGLSKAQKAYTFPPGTDRIEIPFQSTFNLVVLPVEINGVEVQMILDTGASKSIIFNFSGIDSLAVQQGNLIKVNGYGDQDYFQAYYSENNDINIQGYSNTSANLFITADQEINMKSTLGIDVNGLIGASFFKDALVEIDYINNLVILHKTVASARRALRGMSRLPLQFKDEKPYASAALINDQDFLNGLFLIDSGSSDALFLLNVDPAFYLNNKSFKDYLGFGINGDIYGKRTKLTSLKLGNASLDNVTTSIPKEDNLSLPKSQSSSSVLGSIGGEILSRFDIILDYNNKSLYYKKNEDFDSGFFYNMAGMELRVGEKDIVTTIIDKRNEPVQSNYKVVEGQKTINRQTFTRLDVVKKILVKYIRPNSPSEKAGIKEGDEIIAINNLRKGGMSLNDVASKFYKNPYSKVKLKIKRGDKIKTFKIKLIPVI